MSVCVCVCVCVCVRGWNATVEAVREGIGGDFWIIGSQGQNVRGLTLVHSLLAEWNSEENWLFYFKYWSLHIYCTYMLCAGGECIWTDYRNTVFVWPPTIMSKQSHSLQQNKSYFVYWIWWKMASIAIESCPIHESIHFSESKTYCLIKVE